MALFCLTRTLQEQNEAIYTQYKRGAQRAKEVFIRRRKGKGKRVKAGFEVREKAVLRELKQVFKRGWKHSRQDKKAFYTALKRNRNGARRKVQTRAKAQQKEQESILYYIKKKQKRGEKKSAKEGKSGAKWGQGVREEDERKGQGKWKKEKNRCALVATPVLYSFVK